GFLRGDDIDRAYKMVDLYVMPSVSEPFGITPLESMRNGTPVLISKTSGVSEVVNHALKVDFWDINQMASKICATLQYAPLYESLKENGAKEVRKFNWQIPAQKCIDVYNELRGSKIW
ncbi:MAG: 4-alpha-glucanotransferase, partial [Phototrophicales bacterium]